MAAPAAAAAAAAAAVYFLHLAAHSLAECPLDMSGSNFTLLASMCSKEAGRGICCRYINAYIAIAVSAYANATGNLGVPTDTSNTCLKSVSETLEFYGITPNATTFCGLGTKIPVAYQCIGRTTVNQMVQSPKFGDVSKSCEVPPTSQENCRRCLNSGISYLRHLIGVEDNITLSTCRDATFVALTSSQDNTSTIEMAACFFGIESLTYPDNSSSLIAPEAPPSPAAAPPPMQNLNSLSLKESHHSYHLTLIPAIGISITGAAFMFLLLLIFLIRKKSKELKSSGNLSGNLWKSYSPCTNQMEDGPSSMFRRFNYKETKKATGNFSTVLGKGGSGTVYKAQFSEGFIAAVKRINKVSGQGEDEFCRELELLGRLHHRHLVCLRGFCVEKHERFLMYEFMENGSLKDRLHSSERTPINWSTRIQIAIDVANALEYLHFYCDPPLCHRDIKSSNILLDENYVAKVADFGLAHASRTGTVCFEPVNTDIRGTPGYMDPEYVVTQELTEKSDVYSYGVLLLELITAKRAIHENRNLVEWSQKLMVTDSRLHELVDSTIRDSYDFEQLQTVVKIIRWCTQREGKARPSMKQVLRLLHEKLDPENSGFMAALEEEEDDLNKGKMPKEDSNFHSGDARGFSFFLKHIKVLLQQDIFA